MQGEFRPLGKIQDSYPKYLLTLDDAIGNADYDGIINLNKNWLVGK